MKKDLPNLEMRELCSIESVDPRLACKWVHDWAQGLVWQRYRYWQRRLGIPKDARTIETGGGYGKFSMLLGLTGARVTLLDYDQEALSTAVTFQKA